MIMTNQEKIAVLQAAIDGKQVQRQLILNPAHPQCDWITSSDLDDFERYRWRIAPEPPPMPKAREWWLNVYSSNSLYAHATKELAGAAQLACKAPEPPVHVREVLPNEGWVAFSDERKPYHGQTVILYQEGLSPWVVKWSSNTGYDDATHWHPMIPLPK